MYSAMLLNVADAPFLSSSTYVGKHSAKSSNLDLTVRHAVYLNTTRAHVHLCAERCTASCNAELKCVQRLLPD